MSEFMKSTPFEQLEQSVSAQLIEDIDVFALAQEALLLGHATDVTMQPSFKIRPSYSSRIPDELITDGSKANSWMPVTLQIVETGSPASGVEEIGIHFATYKYIELGYVKRDGSDARMYDISGRLLEPRRAEDGTFGFTRSQIDERRINAMAAWQDAHNAFVRAARHNPDMHVDPLFGVWTDDTSERNMSVNMSIDE